MKQQQQKQPQTFTPQNPKTLKFFQVLLKKINKKGFSWFVKRLALELRSPYYPISKKIVSFLVKIKSFHLTSNAGSQKLNADNLNVFYDLNIEPNTFGDFISFLVEAEIFGNQHDKNKLFLWIIPKEIEISEDDDNLTKVLGVHNWEWRIFNVLVPMISLHPSYIGHALLPKGASINAIVNNDLRYPDGFSDNYRPRLPDYLIRRENCTNNSFRGLSAPAQGKKYISDWSESLECNQKLISITIRDYDFDTSRNSNIGEWLKFADWLESKNYKPVFVPDAGLAWGLDKRLKHHTIFRDVCWNVPLRMALYEECALNYFYSNGCANLAMFGKKVPSIVMMPVLADSIFFYEPFVIHDPEIDPRRLAFAEQNQWWSTKIDTFENLTEEFLEYEKLYL